MRRKSDRTKEKEKPSPEKKTEKATRRSRRHSRRRKRSSSVSEHDESATEENDTSMKSSQDDTEEEQKDKRGKEEVDQDNTDVKEKNVQDEIPKLSTSRRKKQITDGTGSKTEEATLSNDDWKEDKSFWEGEEGKCEGTELRHKEKDGKSSVWQVKSSNDSGSSGGGGEIQKIKLCIVRPSESLEPSPRRRKRLSRMSSSHKDKSDIQECEEADDDHGEDDKKMSESSEGKQNLQESSTECTKQIPLQDDEKLSLRECTEQADLLEEASQHLRQDLSEEGQQTRLQNQDQAEVVNEIVDQESRESELNVQDSDVKEVTPFQTSSEFKGDISSETSGEHHTAQKLCDRTVQHENSKEDISSGETRSEECVMEQKEMEVEESCKGKQLDHVAPKELQKEEEEGKLDLHNAAETGSQEELQNVEDSSKTVVEDNEVIVQKSEVHDAEEDKNMACAEQEQDFTCASTEGDGISIEEVVEDSTSEERQKSKKSLEGRPEEPQEVAEKIDSFEERLVAHKVADPLEEGQVRESSEENAAEVSKLEVKVNDTHSKEGTKDLSKDRSNKQTPVKRVFLEERSRSRDSSEERPRNEMKKRRESRESNSSCSFSSSPGKQTHRRGDRESNRRSRIQDNEHSDKHNMKRENNRSTSSDRQYGRHTRRRSQTPQHQREKISLRRSFSRQSNSHAGEKGGTEDSVKEVDALGGDTHLHIKEEKENVRKTSEQTGTSQEPSQNLTRRRRWGAGKTSRAGKKPVLSISTDSLKNLIPGAKPVPVNEVQLSQEEEDRRERESEEHERDESDKREKSKNKDKDRDTQEIVLDKRCMAPLSVSEAHKINVALTDDHRGKVVTRKISIVSDDARTLQNSPSPPRHKASNVLFISNLVRPFTVNQLKELLARTGNIVEGGFWIDKIKSKCYVQYETETEARETRHALHGVRWPVSNPKQLCVDFGKKEDMDLAQALTEEDQIPRKTEPLKVERTVEGWVAEQVREKEREWELREQERERARMKERPHHVIPPMEALERNRNVKMSASVREWDLGKIGQLSPAEKEPKHEEKNKERERRVRREKTRHSRSPSPHNVPARKQKKKEEDAPAKLLDDLFRKTKSTPCIYWLPLTAEQIVVKEEMRRRHMAEHERRMAEMRKAERERQRVRAQQRQQRRTGERDKRRRRTASGSPKK